MANQYSASISELASQYKTDANLSARQRIYRFCKPGGPPWARWVFDQLDLPPNARLLELGCGNAALWSQNVDRIPVGWQIVLSDLSPGMLDAARTALGAHASRFTLQTLDAQSLPFDDQSFDAVIANHMLYHVPDLDRALAGIHRVLVPGGKLFAATNSAAHLYQLKSLIDRFVPLVDDMTHLSFSLENGPELLTRRFFQNVTVHRAPGEMLVTEVEPIVDYILSIEHAKPVVIGPKLAELREHIEKQIADHGSFRIFTEAGLIRAIRN